MSLGKDFTRLAVPHGTLLAGISLQGCCRHSKNFWILNFCSLKNCRVWQSRPQSSAPSGTELGKRWGKLFFKWGTRKASMQRIDKLFSLCKGHWRSSSNKPISYSFFFFWFYKYLLKFHYLTRMILGIRIKKANKRSQDLFFHGDLHSTFWKTSIARKESVLLLQHPERHVHPL